MADEFAAATEAAYQICAAKLQEEVDGVLRQTNRTSFQKIQAFLERNSSGGSGGSGGGGSSESFSQHPYTELPVALVHAGCNTADHALTLRQLLHHLKMNCSPHLAVRPAQPDRNRNPAPTPSPKPSSHHHHHLTRPVPDPDPELGSEQVLRSKECATVAATTRSLVSQLLGPGTRPGY